MKDDLISRQAAIDLAPELIVPNEYKYSMYNQAINNYCVEIMQLPSAQPEQQWIPVSGYRKSAKRFSCAMILNVIEVYILPIFMVMVNFMVMTMSI